MIEKWYRDNLKRFIIFIGEPSGIIVRDYLLLVMSMVYILLGIAIKAFPNSTILLFLGLSSVALQNITVVVLLAGGLFMFVVWLFLYNKICWNRKGKIVTSESCWFLTEILFLLILPLIYCKNFVFTVLRKTRQQTIFTYMPELFLALLLSFLTFGIIELPALKLLILLLEELFHIIVSEEFVALYTVVMITATFFLESKLIVHKSIRIYLRQIAKHNARIDSTEKMQQNSIEDKYNELKAEADQELEYSELYFYVLVNLILLSVHLDENDVYGKMLANAFIGLTALAALFREVNTKKANENIKDKRKDNV